jgi:hypothetical protein
VADRENVVTHIQAMGSEDFSAFLHEVPGAFLAIGSRNEAKGFTHLHHHPRFDVDEDRIAIGAARHAPRHAALERLPGRPMHGDRPGAAGTGDRVAAAPFAAGGDAAAQRGRRT